MSALSDSIAELKENDRQWEAFTTEGHCVVLAPPGSGKTKLLTTRLSYDLNNRIPRPHGAACITLTNAAAEELRRRIDRLGVEPRSTLFVGTVHSFAIQRIISPFCHLVGRPELSRLSIASKQQKDRAYDAAIRTVFGAGGDARHVRSTIERHRQRFATAEQWARSGDEILEVARQYAARLRQAGVHDFLDTLTIAVDMVEQHQAIRKVLTAQYPHMYVDEYQDLAPGLDYLVRALCFDYVANSELFAVGDSDQAVFGFTGTRPELLDELAARRDVTTVNLELNYRSAVEIIRVANHLRPGKTPMIGRRPGGTVSAHRCPAGFADQCQQATLSVSEVLQRGTPLHEIVVICPTNEMCEQAATVLRGHQIPVLVRESAYRQTAVTTFVEECAAWVALGREQSGCPLGSLLKRWQMILRGRWQRSDAIALTELLLSYKDRADDSASGMMNDLLVIGLTTALSRPDMADERVEVAQMAAALETGVLSWHSVRDLADRTRRLNRVEVTTMTSSKGLEFDVVLMLGADEKQVPFFDAVYDPEKLAEERRKFYVSLTRARDEVRIFYSGFVTWKSGKTSRAGPSRFLREAGLV